MVQFGRVLQRQELDAFLAMAVSPLLHDVQTMQDLKVCGFFYAVSFGCPFLCQSSQMKMPVAEEHAALDTQPAWIQH